MQLGPAGRMGSRPARIGRRDTGMLTVSPGSDRMQSRPPPVVGPRRATVLVVCFGLLLGMAGCGGPGPTVPPTRSATPVVTPTVGAPTGPAATTGPTLPPWPVGWDESFCALFAEVVVAQELVVDIERALDEDAMDDAEGLARELRQTAGRGEELIATVGPWAPSDVATAAIATLLDLDGRAGSQYLRFLTENRRPALARARELRADISQAVLTANAGLAELDVRGLTCPGHELGLETPSVEPSP